jgi:hydroxyacylglutathione hydrolase
MSDFLRFGKIKFIPGLNKGRYPYCHSLIVEDEVTAVIDPASDERALGEIHKERGIDTVILSHYHEDHWMYMKNFKGAKLWMHGGDSPTMDDLDRFMEWYGITDPQELTVMKEVLRKQFNYEERMPERTFKDGDILEVGSIRIEVVHTPGHTPGHCCFYFPEEKVLFLADIDLTKIGPWYGDKYSDIDAFIRSVEKVRRIPAKFYITAHEDGVIEGDPGEMWDKYLRIIDIREEKLRELIKEPRSIGEIVEARIVFGKPREPKLFYDLGERLTMLKHLERMMRHGQAELVGDKYRLTK